MRILATCALMCFAAGAFGQAPPAPTWQIVASETRHRGEIKDMEIAANGDIVVAGFAPTGKGGSDAWIARYDDRGRKLWSQSVGGATRDEALDLALSPDGSFIIAGWRDVGRLQTDSSNGFIAKIAPDGAVLWDQTIVNGSNLILVHIMALENGDILVSGGQGANPSKRSSFLGRFGGDGQLQWEVLSTPPAMSPAEKRRVVSLVDPFEDSFELQKADGAAVIARRFDGACSTVSLDGHPLSLPCEADKIVGQEAVRFTASATGYFDDAVVRKYLGSSLVWERALKSPERGGFNSVTPTADGGAVAAGFSLRGEKVEMHNWDALLVKLDSDGYIVWQKNFGGGRRDEFRRVAMLGDGSIIVAGYTGSQGQYEWAPWLLRLDASGELIGEAKRGLEAAQR